MMRRCLLVAALVVAVGCGASSPTQPDPQPPSGGGTPIIDARTACGLSPTHRDRTSVLSIDLGVVAQPLDIGGFAPDGFEHQRIRHKCDRLYHSSSGGLRKPARTIQCVVRRGDADRGVGVSAIAPSLRHLISIRRRLRYGTPKPTF
jgi:hypothetical protein